MFILYFCYTEKLELMKTQTDISVLCIIIYLLIFLLINSALLYHISIKVITKIQKKKKGKKENRVQFYLKLLTTGWKWSRILSPTATKKIEPPLKYCGKITKQ